MRQEAGFLLATLAFLFIASPAKATPVYLRLDSLFPSGHHQRQFLEAKTKKVQFQRWLRVQTPSGAFGWLPEDHLVTPLKLATEAVTTEEVPVRNEMQMDSIGSRTLPKSQVLLILEIQGSWVRAQPLGLGDFGPTWIPTESLRPHASAQTAKAYALGRAPVFLMASASSRRLGEIKSGTYVSVQRESNGWREIVFQGGAGFVRAEDLVTLSDLGDTRVHSLVEGAPLRSAPLPYADLITGVARRTPLKVVETKSQRWGQARVPETGDVWWMISDDFDEHNSSGARTEEKILTRELFSRKIFDMASSRAIPQLKLVSAHGIFRTIDGQEWTRIPQFKDENHPIAIATDGEVFVGPYLSEDHGETFQSWIRWDTLVATLKRRFHVAPKTLRIVDIRPEDASGRRVTLKLSVGPKEQVKVRTEDQGRTWEAL